MFKFEMPCFTNDNKFLKEHIVNIRVSLPHSFQNWRLNWELFFFSITLQHPFMFRKNSCFYVAHIGASSISSYSSGDNSSACFSTDERISNSGISFKLLPLLLFFHWSNHFHVMQTCFKWSPQILCQFWKIFQYTSSCFENFAKRWRS